MKNVDQIVSSLGSFQQELYSMNSRMEAVYEEALKTGNTDLSDMVDELTGFLLEAQSHITSIEEEFYEEEEEEEVA